MILPRRTEGSLIYSQLHLPNISCYVLGSSRSGDAHPEDKQGCAPCYCWQRCLYSCNVRVTVGKLQKWGVTCQKHLIDYCCELKVPSVSAVCAAHLLQIRFYTPTVYHLYRAPTIYGCLTCAVLCYLLCISTQILLRDFGVIFVIYLI